MPEINMSNNDTLSFPWAHFFSDPDSLKNDMSYELVNNSSQISVEVINDSIQIITQGSWKGIAFFTLRAQHDSIWQYSVNCVNVAQDEPISGICPGSNEFFIAVIQMQEIHINGR
jgi:hypothetical protein